MPTTNATNEEARMGKLAWDVFATVLIIAFVALLASAAGF